METPAGCTRPWADPSHGWAAVMYQEEPMENLSEVEGRKSTVKSNSARDPAGSSTRSGPHELDTTRKVSLRRSTTDELPGVHNVHNGRALANLVTRHMAEAPGPGQWPAPESNSQLLQRLESQVTAWDWRAKWVHVPVGNPSFTPSPTDTPRDTPAATNSTQRRPTSPHKRCHALAH